MKKRIFITTQYLEIGGVERSLIGLLNAIDYSKYDVDLFLYRYGGDFFKMIPKEVNLLPELIKYSKLSNPMIDVIKKGSADIVLARLFARWKSNQYYKKSKSKKENFSIYHYVSKYTSPLLPTINSNIEYDLAIGFISPFHVLRDKVRAKKKIGWIHTDFSILEIDSSAELPVWNSCDYIASISEGVTSAFLKTFPSLKNKIVLIENILSPAFVREQAQTNNVSEEMPNKKSVTKLLSVGRYSTAKNFDNLPFICKKLIESGCNVIWYIVGYGRDETLIINNIEEAKMQKHVILLGKKSNPYPYMQACDIYVQPSRYEGKAVTVREAQMLYKPVVITNFPTAQSQLTNGVDGVIVPIDNDGAAKGLHQFIENKALQAQLVDNLSSRDYGNENEVEKIYKLID
ncbi:glycosyltransferase [Ancylomarina sp. YFZ004]